MNKIKVAWLCHFSNEEIRQYVKPSRPVSDFAPWMSHLVNAFRRQNGIELFIIAPHEYIRGIRKFDLDGIHYLFFNPFIPFFGRHWPGFFRFDYFTNFILNKLIVRRLISAIKPDLIHLHGAENPYYSSTILQFRYKYPVLITVQGFISHATGSLSWLVKRNIAHEKKIMTSYLNFGVRTDKMARDTLAINPDAKLHWHGYGMEVLNRSTTKPDYDLVYFGVINAHKGVDVLIKALGLVVKSIESVKVKIIGSGSRAFVESQKRIASELGLVSNIEWLGYLPTQKEVHDVVSHAKIAVLPSVIDIIPGTIIESMMLGLPVISAAAGSIPELDSTGSALVLVAPGDHIALAKEIIRMLRDESYRTKVAQNGRELIVERYGNSNSYLCLQEIYKNIIHDDFVKHRSRENERRVLK